LLGNVFVTKDEVDEVMNGEAIIICPGYNKENFSVNQSDKGVVVTVFNKHINCGDIDGIEEFTFDFNEYFKVKKVSYNVRDGIFILQVDYITDNNVEIDEDL